MAISSELTTPTAAELKQQMVEDLQLQALDAGVEVPPIEPGGEWDLMTTGDANIGSVLLANQQILDEDSDPLRATGAALDEWRKRLSLPEVLASVASGPVTITVLGTGTIPTGLQLQAPNGFRCEVPAGYVGVTGAVQANAQMLADFTGTDGNLLAGTRLKIIGGPPNLVTEATVPTDWTGGNPDEDDTRKRERIINRLRNGNSAWGDLRASALDSTGAISDAYVYPALGGPGSVKVAVLSNTSNATRSVGAVTIADIQAYIEAAFPWLIWKVVVQSTIDRPVDVAVGLTLPDSGDGKWLAAGPTGITYVSVAGTQTNFTTVGPLGTLAVNDVIACWDAATRTFATAQVLTLLGQDITTTPWKDGSGPIVGSWICPACEDLGAIAAAFVAEMKRLGPGENVASSDPAYRFAKRRPLESTAYPMRCSSKQLNALQTQFGQIIDIDYINTIATPVPPALKGDAPEVLTLARFGVYPL